MTREEPLNAHELHLEIQGMASGGSRFSLSLSDDGGRTRGGFCTLDGERRIRGGATWNSFLSDYLKQGVSDDLLAAFGADLFRWLVHDSGLTQEWATIQAAAGLRPLHLTVAFGAGSELLAELPLELLHDDQGFVFARPGSGLVRELLFTEARHFERLTAPRVLLTWACPDGAGEWFDPGPHREALQSVFGERMQELECASLDALGARLAEAQADGEPFDYLHVVAHGYRDDFVGGICLADGRGRLDCVEAGRLAQVVRGKGLSLAFLCSCKTAVAGPIAFSGVGQRLLAPQGGDLPCVVATQANLPVRGSATLAGRFYRHLKDGSGPGEALAYARREAYQSGRGGAWSVPVLLSRPAPRGRAPGPTADVYAALPRRRETYQERPALHEEVLEAVRKARRVSIVGLPGIGKTELGREGARLARKEGVCERLIYLAAHLGMEVGQVRLQVARALGLAEIPEDDAVVAAALARDGRSTLLVIDNAEDLMRSEAAQDAFRVQVEQWLDGAPRLRVLLTTRWAMGGEREVHVPPMTREQTEKLLEAELKHLGVMKEEWRGGAAWRRLVELIDGHPRSLMLLASRFTLRGTTVEEVVRQLERHREGAIVEADLLGQKRAFEALPGEARARLKSLVATMELSYEVLERQYPEAAQAFGWLSFFPGGLPESVAYEVAGGDESMALKQLLRMHVVEWHDERTFYPVPLHWYAERKRKAAEVDERAVYQRVLRGFVDFTRRCDERYIGGDELGGMTRLLAEERTLVQLAAWVEGHGEQGGEGAALARIAATSHNALEHAHRLEAARALLMGGLRSAETLADPLGQAGCRLGLGRLAMREDDLSGAREAYEKALPLYREIRARLGEANCLQGLGLLALATGDSEQAFSRFLEVLQQSRDIKDQSGQQAAHGYLARVAAKAGALDQALLLAEASLDIGRRIRDRFGQTITHKLQLDIFAQQQNGLAAIATASLLRDLHASMNDAPAVDRYTQLLASIPAELLATLQPERARQAALAEARQRFQSTGRDLYFPPSSTP